MKEKWLCTCARETIKNEKSAIALHYIFSRYETESAGKIEELEHAKMKLQARLAEAEDTIEGIAIRFYAQLNGKFT